MIQLLLCHLCSSLGQILERLLIIQILRPGLQILLIITIGSHWIILDQWDVFLGLTLRLLNFLSLSAISLSCLICLSGLICLGCFLSLGSLIGLSSWICYLSLGWSLLSINLALWHFFRNWRALHHDSRLIHLEVIITLELGSNRSIH